MPHRTCALQTWPARCARCWKRTQRNLARRARKTVQRGINRAMFRQTMAFCEEKHRAASLPCSHVYQLDLIVCGSDDQSILWPKHPCYRILNRSVCLVDQHENLIAVGIACAVIEP